MVMQVRYHYQKVLCHCCYQERPEAKSSNRVMPICVACDNEKRLIESMGYFAKDCEGITHHHTYRFKPRPVDKGRVERF